LFPSHSLHYILKVFIDSYHSVKNTDFRVDLILSVRSGTLT
jgi:hypothetical protein